MKLHAGKNLLTAVAKDAAGNTSRSQSTVFELLARTRKASAKRRNHAVVVDSGHALACPLGSGRCTTTVTGMAGPGKVGGATAKTPAGKRRELKFKLNPTGEKALHDKRHLKIKLKIDIRYGKLAHVTTTRSFALQRP